MIHTAAPVTNRVIDAAMAAIGSTLDIESS
jgi:hypothetical protein